MPLDDRLRDALHDDAGEPDDATDWSVVRARGTRIRQKRRALSGGAALATITIILGVVAASEVGDRDSAVVSVPAGDAASTEVVVAVGDATRGEDRLSVLSADDGRELRTIAEDIGNSALAGISVSPGGQTAYFTRVQQGLPCGVSEIMRVPVDGSAEPELVSPGSNPVLSPDGSRLAYSRPPEPGGECASFGAVAVRELSTGSERVVDVGPTVRPLSWSPDGMRLVVGAIEQQRYGGITVYRAADFAPHTYLDLPAPDSADDATFLPDGRLVVALLDESNSRRRLVTFGDSGTETGTLFETDPTGVTGISSDATGQLLLHFGGDELQRWREGDSEPTAIARGVRDAAWVPKTVERGRRAADGARGADRRRGVAATGRLRA